MLILNDMIIKDSLLIQGGMHFFFYIVYKENVDITLAQEEVMEYTQYIIDEYSQCIFNKQNPSQALIKLEATPSRNIC